MGEYIYSGIDKFETARRFQGNIQGVAKKSAHHNPLINLS
jgi:hypothetical protein